MPKYDVSLPITGYVYLEAIEAESRQEAIEKALGQDIDFDDIVEWSAIPHVTQGNVFCGMQNSATAEERADD